MEDSCKAVGAMGQAEELLRMGRKLEKMVSRKNMVRKKVSFLGGGGGVQLGSFPRSNPAASAKHSRSVNLFTELTE